MELKTILETYAQYSVSDIEFVLSPDQAEAFIDALEPHGVAILGIDIWVPSSDGKYQEIMERFIMSREKESPSHEEWVKESCAVSKVVLKSMQKRHPAGTRFLITPNTDW